MTRGHVETSNTKVAKRREKSGGGNPEQDEFIEWLVAGFGTFPSYFARLPELNRRGPTRYDFRAWLALTDGKRR